MEVCCIQNATMNLPRKVWGNAGLNLASQSCSSQDAEGDMIQTHAPRRGHMTLHGVQVLGSTGPFYPPPQQAKSGLSQCSWTG